MVDLANVLADLEAEGAELDAMIADLDAEQWASTTPAQGWTIAHQIAHLAWTDEVALTATRHPEEFPALVDAAAADPDGFVDAAAEEGARAQPAGILERWRAGRANLRSALADVTEDARLPWFGPSMRPASMATARIMETWAHGQDVADTLGVIREPTARLFHVAHIGVRARDFAYQANARSTPDEPFRVELDAPDGARWTWGPAEAHERVSGDALEFCLVVTQRRHRDDTDLRVQGSQADEWLSIAQAFAGNPGTGRKAGQFT